MSLRNTSHSTCCSSAFPEHKNLTPTTSWLSHEKTQENLKVYPDHTGKTLTTLKLESITQKMLYEDFAAKSKPHGSFVKKGGYHIICSFKICSLHKAFQCFGLLSCPVIQSSVRLRLCYSMPYDNNLN